MPKQQSGDQTRSPFDALKIARIGKAEEPLPATPDQRADIQTFRQLGVSVSKRLAKSLDPTYTKFTIYVKKTTHRSVKTALVSQDREMSDLVEDLLGQWLEKEQR